ncbi:MAG: hypothetical protein HGB11_08150 [Chlorobiales bacterium]|nr:hypothetical protein [Chlorobiales bacterium]
MQFRRLRLLASGKIADKTSFRLATEVTGKIGNINVNGEKVTPNSGDNSQTSQKTVIGIIEAYVDQSFIPELSVTAGLQRTGVSRIQLQSSAKLSGLDASVYSSLQDKAFGTFSGRDFGANLRGYVLDDALEYRLGVFTGKTVNSSGGVPGYSEPFRTVGRVSYSVLDKENEYNYVDTYLGKGQYLSFGGGFDLQSAYKSFGADAFLDVPVTDDGSLKSLVSFVYYDGGTKTGSALDKYFMTAVPRQYHLYADLGYYIKSLQLMPYAKFEYLVVDGKTEQLGLSKNASDDEIDYANKIKATGSLSTTGAQSGPIRWGLGVSWFFQKYNSNLKLEYDNATYYRAPLSSKQVNGPTGKPTVTEKENASEVTLQWQWYFL